MKPDTRLAPVDANESIERAPHETAHDALHEEGHGEIPRVHRPARALPTDVVRPTRAEVHLAHLRHNLGVLRRAVGSVPIWAVLKADGYGHGAKAVARTFERAGVDGVCVAMVEEGVELRDAGIRLPILVMGGYYGNALREFVHHRLTPVLSDRDQIKTLAAAVEHAGTGPLTCHVKVDTGMARLGMRHAEWPDLVRALKERPELTVSGLMTHLANADTHDVGALEEPLALFSEAQEMFARAGVPTGLCHMANSAAVLRDARTHFDFVRPGVALFGVDPLASLPGPLRGETSLEGRFKPAMSVVSRIVSLRTLARGEAVGYGGTFVAKEPTIVATVPMGYADGFSRRLSNRARVLVQGKRVPVVGNISMDMMMLDVTRVPGVAMMDEVVFLGHQKGTWGEDTISAHEVAQWSDTIPWEVLTNISRRVPRFYREA